MQKTQFDYLQQNSTLTLREGMAEYMAGFTHLNKNDGQSEACRWFYCHDCTHVLFGTIPFDIRGENINDVWTLFGSNMTIRGYLKFFTFVDYDVVLESYVKKHKSKARVYLQFLAVLPAAFIPMIRGLKMKKKWNWFEPDQHLDTPLCELRAEYGIKVISG